MQSSNNNRKGFVFFEVLVAITILSVSCLLIVRTIVRSMKLFESSQEQYQAGLMMEEILYQKKYGGGSSIAEINSDESLKNMRWDMEEDIIAKGHLKESRVRMTWDTYNGRKEEMTLSDYHDANETR